MAKVTLGGIEYDVRPFNIDQLERAMDVLSNSENRVHSAFQVLRIALERIEPKVAIEDVEATPEQIREAVQLILVASGLKQVDPSAGEAQPEGTPAA